jgi:hypothetical protein
MTNLPRLALIILLALSPTLPGRAEELAPFGELPKPGKDWAAHKSGKDGPASWTIWQNARTGDLLSFFARPRTAGEKNDLLSFSDSACEVFCADGERPANDSKERYNVAPIRFKVVPLGLVTGEKKHLSNEALEYTWVEEPENGGETRMANGYVMFFGDTCIFVQHTSKKPITAEFVQDVAVQLIALRGTAAKGK